MKHPSEAAVLPMFLKAGVPKNFAIFTAQNLFGVSF